MKISAIAIAILAIASLTGCSDNTSAKAWGGTMTVDLPPKQKLVNVIWKDANLWYLTRPAKPGETPETFTFKEKSDFGMVEGKVTVQEH